tara:strand:+ start:1436 stop:2527 length:1092 start_codon:yes stop_codon:yes gene_type:complete
MSEIRVDTISEKTSANGVAVDGVTLKDGGGTFTSPVLVPDGSTSAVSLGNDGDPNTGIYFQAADSLGLVLGGSRKLSATSAGVAIENGTLSAKGGAVFNEDSADVDFRVESNGNTHMLFVDGGNNAVGIGNTGTLDGVVHIKGTSADTYVVLEAGATDGNTGLLFHNSAGTQESFVLYDTDDDYLALGAGSAERVRVHSNGVAAFNNGIALGVGTANTASNVLDDYEEGTWTPVVKSNNNTISRSGGNEFHTYTKIGRMVNITFTLQAVTLSGTIDNSGDFTYITGLPFTSSSTAGQRSPSTEILYFTSGSKFTEGNVTGTVGPNVSKVEILEHDGAGTGYSSARLANLTSNTYWMFNLTYYV